MTDDERIEEIRRLVHQAFREMRKASTCLELVAISYWDRLLGDGPQHRIEEARKELTRAIATLNEITKIREER